MAANTVFRRGFGISRSPLFYATGAAIVAAALLVGALLPTAVNAVFSNSDAGILSGILLVLAAGAPTALRLRRHPLDAPALYAISTMLFLGLTSLVWLGEPVRPGPGLNQAIVAEALRLVAVALAVFGAAAWLVAPRRSNPPTEPADWSSPPSSAALLTSFGLSFIGIIIAFSLGTYGYISDTTAIARTSSFAEILSVIGIAGSFVLLATAVNYYATPSPQLLRLLVLFVTIEMIVGFVSGNKRISLLPLLFVLGAYVLARRRLPALPMVIVTVFFLVIVVPINARYRDNVRGNSLAPREALPAAVRAPLELNPSVVALNASNYVGLRFRSIDSVGLIVDQTPTTFPYAGGENYVLLPAIALIPRALWPEKPNLDDAGRFTQTYNQAPSSVRSATQITEIGDLYRNFGYVGVVVGMLCVGLAVGGAARAYQHYRSPRADLVYVYAAMTIFIYIDSDLPALIATASKTLPFAVITAWLLLPGRTSPPGYYRLTRRFTDVITPRQRAL